MNASKHGHILIVHTHAVVAISSSGAIAAMTMLGDMQEWQEYCRLHPPTSDKLQ